jgi:glycosyltransferase involved in cell wall biosynthesis
MAGLLAAKLMNLTVIGQYHTDFKAYALKLTGDPTVALMVDGAVGWFYKAMDRVLVPSEWTATMVKEMGVAPEKVQQVARGIDLNLFKPERGSKDAYVRYGLNGEPKLLYVGRVSKEKNLHELVDTFEKVREAHTDARLVIVGDGPFTDELKAMFPSDGVVFTGMVRGEELARLYASSDIFVFPSETETFGNVVVEAQAAGLPVVVSNRGAAKENVVQGVTGFVCDTRDAIQTSEYISKLLGNHELRTKMGKAATDFANQYSMEVAANKTMETYREIFDTIRCA